MSKLPSRLLDCRSASSQTFKTNTLVSCSTSGVLISVLCSSPSAAVPRLLLLFRENQPRLVFSGYCCTWCTYDTQLFWPHTFTHTRIVGGGVPLAYLVLFVTVTSTVLRSWYAVPGAGVISTRHDRTPGVRLDTSARQQYENTPTSTDIPGTEYYCCTCINSLLVQRAC